MTEVVNETTAVTPWKSLPADPKVASGTRNNVRLLDSRRIQVAPLRAGADAARPPFLEAATDALRAPVARERSGVRFLSRIRAWMVVPVVDFILMVAPLAWRPPQPLATVTMAVLATLLLAEGGRYGAPLHLSVLDEFPNIVARLLTAVAAVSTVILYLHHKSAVLVFFETACQAVLLVIVGRVITTRLIAIGRRSGITKHNTILIGGGPVATELARILAEHREYGLKLDGFVDDGDECPVEDYLPRLGRLADVDRAMLRTGADTLLIADGNFQESAVADAVRTEACQHAELLVVPRMHHFHTQTGMADHIGSIPIMRIRNPNLGGPTRFIKRGFDIAVAVTALDGLVARTGRGCDGCVVRGRARRDLPASQSRARRQTFRALEVSFDAAIQ